MELRDFLFSPLKKQRFNFTITVREKGIFSGAGQLEKKSAELRIDVASIAPEGSSLLPGRAVFRASGEAEQVARAEETLLGVIGKPSGVATAAADFVRQSKGKIKVVCGAWKKVAPELRMDLRRAIATGGAGIRITDQPFVYLDKNYVRMFGGIGPAVRRAGEFDAGRLVVVQLRGEKQPVADEAREAVEAGAAILMIDTGDVNDLKIVLKEAVNSGWREKVQIAFAGGVTGDELAAVIAAGADIVDVGRAIIDAPMLDFRLDVQAEGA
ncbi:nicotinate-nucleotide pyrophosphorylase [Desulfotomaculum copahuensis]|uniref:Nicotinate-nucleotide pyrophosphorylase n=1 Tax=Desulfotomaculum copahuensis TaxID=1838280 RepID=A0A1B7LIU4_9FIRM|nr:nicotinate-nucleotide pyrophosphorylase [Desulfotomaculum copahuensis]OAT86391.1 nicotinate-nucleotide pyrophosphorylase [Desulfotomaculum copahuensis]